MAFFKWLTMTSAAKAELGSGKEVVGDAVYRAFASLLDAGSLGEPVSAGAQIISVSWKFFSLVWNAACARVHAHDQPRLCACRY
jgi:hypothetical protein